MNSLEGKRCLGVITARGGSKGVSGKNARSLCGRPLVEYPVRLLKACPYISKVMITTDSPLIRDLAVQAGAEAPFLRPPELATDRAKQEDAILHVMDWCEAHGERYDYICLTTPTTPLGQVKTLNESFELLASRPDAEGVFSVFECDFSPLRTSQLRSDGLMKDWMDPKIKWLNRQEIPPSYRLSGIINISTWEAFRREKTFLQDKTLYKVIDPVEALDINTPYDFFIVERLMEAGFYHSSHLADYFAKRPVIGLAEKSSR